MYSARLLDHFEHPRNVGTLTDADLIVTRENPACGDILSLSLKISQDTIISARFQAKGCVPTIACASALTELIIGKSAAELQEMDHSAVITRVGGVPPASSHAAQLAMDVLAGVLEKLQLK